MVYSARQSCKLTNCIIQNPGFPCYKHRQSFQVLFLPLPPLKEGRVPSGHTENQGLNSLFCITPLLFQAPNSLRFHAHPNHNRDNPICIVIFHYLIINVSFHNWSRTLSIPWLFCYWWDIPLKALNCIYRVLTALLFVYFVTYMKSSQRCSQTTRNHQAGW